MKLVRLKITDPKGFRSLPYGFEHHFRSEWTLQDELDNTEGFAPFVCAGPNGSGKSNLLEVLAAIFYHIECMVLGNLPDSFLYDKDENPKGFNSANSIPSGFELEYWIKPKDSDLPGYAKVLISKETEQSPKVHWQNRDQFYKDHNPLSREETRSLLPEYLLGYSSGENEILSLPFFKMRFIQFDEYWQALRGQLPYRGTPESRLIYLDSSFSQAILLSNLLFQDDSTLTPFRKEIGIGSLKEFRIVLKRSISLSPDVVNLFGKNHPCVYEGEDENTYRLNLLKLLEADDESADNFDPIITRLKRCATSSLEDRHTDSLYIDYFVDQSTHDAFQNNFGSALGLFQAFQVLLTLNLYSVSATLKAELYQSDSQYVSETVPTLASDERIMRFKNFYFTKQGVDQPMLLKELSDGEHQLLHSLGLCLLFRNTNSLFLLDEPETHFNPDWRANFISRLRQCFTPTKEEEKRPDKVIYSQEMLITTHTPFLISDSKPEKVLVFNKDKTTGEVSISHPEYNTLGASINKITMNTFGKRETIGAYAKGILDDLRKRFEQGDEDNETLIDEIHHQLGDSVEKLLLIKAILANEEDASKEDHEEGKP